MKLSPQSQLGLAFTTEMRLGIFRLQNENMDRHNVTPEEKLVAFKQIEGLFSDNNNQYFVFRNPALAIAERIKLDKGKLEDLSFLNSVKDKKVTYLMGRNLFYRWTKFDHIIMVGCVKTWEENSGKGLNYWIFKINTETGELIFPEDKTDKEFEDLMMQFVRLFVFTELSELETIILKPKEKSGTKKSGKYINNSSTGIVVVDSTWNKRMICKDGFSVSGHLRLQRFGEGRKMAKLILIEEFHKSGYVRRARRETANEMA